MKKKQIFIHIGFPKTGTTYLQQNIFPLMKQTLLDRDGIPISILEKKILQLNETQYEQEKEELIKSLEKIFNQKNKKYILSHEGFLRSTRYNQHQNPISNNIFETLKRLNEIFSNYCEVNFILVIRKYDEMLRSYLQQFHNQFEFKYDENNFLKNLRNDETEKNILKNFYYGKIINFIDKLKVNYKVLIYEDLKNRPEFFHSQLFDFIDIHIDYKNEILNSSKDKLGSREMTLLKRIINNYNNRLLFKKIFKLSSYIRLIKYFNISLKENKKFFNNPSFFNKYKKEIYDFYISDFKKLPKNIQIICDKYNYLNK